MMKTAHVDIIKPRQIKAARALLDWSQEDLAAATDLSIATIRKIELGYCEYRTISKHYINSVPFYIYGNKYAAIIFNAENSPKIIVIESPAMSSAFRQQFYSMWEKATPLNTILMKEGNFRKSLQIR